MTLMFADFFKSLIPNLNIQPLDGLPSQVKKNNLHKHTRKTPFPAGQVFFLVSKFSSAC